MFGGRQLKAAQRAAGRLGFESLESRVVMSATGLLQDPLAAIESTTNDSAQMAAGGQTLAAAPLAAAVLSIEDWVHALAESQYSQLLPEQVQYLSTEQLRSMKLPEYFKLWSPAARAALTAPQVQLLNIGALGISQLNAQQIGSLTVPQIQQVKFYEFQLLQPAQIPSLTANQIRSIPHLGYFQMWSAAARAALTPTQVQNLNISTIGISKLTIQQVGWLTTPQVQSVRFYELQLLQSGQVPYLTTAQIRSIEHQGYFRSWSSTARAALTPDQVQSLNISTIGISLLTPLQISWLSVPQIQAVRFYEFQLLQPSQIPYLNSLQLTSFPHMGYFQALPAASRAALTPPQVQVLNISMLGLSLLTPSQIGWLTAPQIQMVRFAEFPLLRPFQIPTLSVEQVRTIPHLGYFQLWSPQARAALTATQVQNLNILTIGVAQLTSQQIGWLTVPQIQSVKFYEFQYLLPGQISSLTVDQIRSVEHLGYFKTWSAAARAALTPTQVQNLNIATIGIGQLTSQQIGWLTVPQIQATPLYEFAYLLPFQIPSLSAAQIQAISQIGYLQGWSTEARAALQPWQIQLLRPEALSLSLLTGGQISALTTAQIQSLMYSEIPRLYPSQIPLLTPAQVASVPSGAFLSDLPETSQRALTREQLLALPLQILADFAAEQVPPSNYHSVEETVIGPDGLPIGAHSDEAARLFALAPRASATHVTVASGVWSDPGIWLNGIVPAAGAKVLISSGTTVQFDSFMNVAINTLRIDGMLTFATNRNTQLKADTIVVYTTGKLYVGTAANPIQDNVTARILIADNGPINTAWDPYLLSRGIISRGEVRMFGKTVTPYVNLTVDPKMGDTKLYLAQVPTNWRVGDRIVVTGVDGKMMDTGAEERTILAIDGSVVTIDALRISHDAPDGIGAQLQVANLSRNVVLAAEDDSVIAERPHMMFMHNPNVQLQNIGVYGFGRTDKSTRINDPQVLNGTLLPNTGTNVRARYAIHFHHTGVDPQNLPAAVTGSVVVGSPGWGYVNHSSNVNFDNNVAYQVFGAAFVSEDGNEIGAMTRNLAIGTFGVFAEIESRTAIHDFGFVGHGFWLQGPGVQLIGNISAGSRGAGFVIYTSSTKNLFDAVNLDDPAYAGGQKVVPVGTVPFQKFDHNVAYAAHTGVDVWRHMEVMTDGLSVIDNFFSWNTWAVGADFHYSGRLLIRNSRLIGDLQNYVGTGVNTNFLCRDIFVENVNASGFEVGFHLPVRRGSTINGGVVAAVTGVWVEKGHVSNRSLSINGLRFTTLTAAQLQGRTQYDILLTGPYDFRPFPARRVDSLFSEDLITYTPYGSALPIRLYYNEQLPSFVPFPSATAMGYVPNEYLNKTNLQLQQLYGVVYRGGMVPSNAFLLPRVSGWAAL